jgi:hypothetical protein
MNREIYYTNRWGIGRWQFFEIDGRQISDSYEGRKLFGYETQAEDGVRPEPSNVREWFNSLEHAMAAAIAEKYTGPRGAGGSGVGTAADWFMRMIGADQLVDAGEPGRRALAESMGQHRDKGFLWAATLVERDLERQGLILARQNHA